MDTVYPQPLSRQRRTERRPRDRGSNARYHTQPVTFSEIQEVDEENLDEDGMESVTNSGPIQSTKSEHDLKAKLDTLILNGAKESEQRSRKKTLKSLKRLAVDGKPSPACQVSPDSPSGERRLLTQPRTSI